MLMVGNKETTETNTIVTDQSIFKSLYKDVWVVLLQIGLVVIILFDFIVLSNLRSNHNWLLAITLSVSVVLFFTPQLNRRFLSKATYIHSLFHILTALFMIYVVPVGSPYEFIYIILIYTAIYWYGHKGFWLSLFSVIAMLFLAEVQQSDLINSYDWYSLALKSLLLFILGGLLDRLHLLDLIERKELVNVSKDASFEHQRLLSLINSMADAVIAMDKEGKVLFYNGAALEVLNTNQNIIGVGLDKFMSVVDSNKRAVSLVEQVGKSKVALKRDDLLLRFGENEYMNIYVSLAPVHLHFDAAGNEGYILVFRDITKEKSIEEQRDEFISVVSHELRTPIAIAEANISNAMLPSSLEDKSKAKDFLEQAHKNVIFLSDMVNDITTLAHAERGDLDAELEEVHPNDVLKELLEAYHKEAEDKKLGLTIKTNDSVQKILSNNYRIKEILQDFITNALKYTDEGHVIIGVKDMGNGVRFYVEDTGIGLSRSDAKHTFDKFWRSEDYRTRTHKGTGLGLYIAKKLAERMSGTVGVESELNKGSTFYLDLPYKIKSKSKASGGEE